MKEECQGKSVSTACSQSSKQIFLLRRVDCSRQGAEASIHWEDATRGAVNGRDCWLSFNQDNNPSTPCFVVKSETEGCEIGKQHSETMMLKKIASCSRSSSHILQPKPLSDYCSVCRERFTDYRSHIKHPFHYKNIQNSLFQPHIEQLFKSFQRHSKIAVRRQFKMGEGRKRRKLNEEGSNSGEITSTDLSESLFFNELKSCRPSRS